MESNNLWHDDQEYLLTLQVQYLNDLLDNMNEIFYTYNTDGIMTFVNKKIKDILGYEQKELVGKCVWEIVHPDYKEVMIKETKKRLQKGKGKREIYLAKVVRKDGAARTIRINVATIEENGQIIGEAALAEDVTEARQNEKALKQSNQMLQETKNKLMEVNQSLVKAKEELRQQLEEAEQHKEAVTTAHHKLENIMDFLPDPTIVIDARGKVTLWNKAMEGLTGVKARDMIGKDNREYSVIFYGRRRPMLIDYAAGLADMNNAAENYDDFQQNENDLFADQYVPQLGIGGTIVAGRATPLYDDYGNLVGAIETVTDLSERLKTLRELKDSEEKYRNIIESMEDGYFEVTIPGEFLLINRYLHTALGYTREELIGQSFRKIMDEDNAKMIRKAFINVYQTKELRKSFDWEVRRRDGSKMFTETTILPIMDDKDEVIGFRGIVRDITERKKNEQALMASEQKLQERVSYLNALIQNLNELFITYDLNGKITFINNKGTEIGGYLPEEIIGKHVNIFVPEEYHDLVMQEIAIRIGKGESAAYELPMRHNNGSYIMTKINSTPIINENGEIEGGMILAEDITATKKAQQELATSEKRYRAIVQDQTELICRFMPDLTLTFVNKAFCRYFNKPEAEIIGRKIPYYKLAASEKDYYRQELLNVTPQEPVKQFEFAIHLGNEDKNWLSWTIRGIFNEQDTIIEYQGVGRDITMSKQAENQLIFMSTHDGLTGLYNRLYFEQQMQNIQNNDLLNVGLIICDVDGLKLINDTLGHAEGDNTLCKVADIIRSCFRRQDIIARVGGDEFAILLPCADSDTIAHAIDRIRRTVRTYNLSADIPVSMSIGAASRTSLAVTMDDVYKEADNNMYREKLHSSNSARSAIVQTLTNALKERDYITEGHAERLQELVEKIAQKLGMDERVINDLRLFAQFHDIGKVGVPDAILFKTSSLTEDERLIMQRHSEIGHRIALSAPEMVDISDWILKHHEWWNGEGYPLKLRGEDIPLECRILAVADAYDAMTSYRPYRRAMTHQEAVEELIKFAGIQFDPDIVDVFIALNIGNQSDSDNDQLFPSA